jgi:hypothetical protein
LAVGLLIDGGRLQAHFTVAGLEDQIAADIDANLLSTLERQLNDIRVRAGGDDEVVFELPLITVVDEVHPGINILVTHSPVLWNLSVPVPAIAADDVIALSRQFVVLRNLRCRVAVNELHPQFMRSVEQSHDGFGRCEKECVTSASRHELDIPHGGAGLTAVGLEAERLSAVRFGNSNFRPGVGLRQARNDGRTAI